jgi:hypothetical protein
MSDSKTFVQCLLRQPAVDSTFYTVTWLPSSVAAFFHVPIHLKGVGYEGPWEIAERWGTCDGKYLEKRKHSL